MNQVLSRVNDLTGTFPGADEVPPAGSASYTVAADMPAAQVADASNWLALAVEVQSGGAWLEVARSPAWQGGPGQSAPSLKYTFPVTGTTAAPTPPGRIRGVLLNGVRGAGSPAVCGLLSQFA